MAEGDALGLAGRAGGEEQRRLVVAAALVQVEEQAKDFGGEDFGNDGPGDDLLLERGKDALDEDQVAVRRPWK